MKPDRRMPGRALPALAGAAGLLLAVTMIAALSAGGLLAEGGRIAELAWGRMLLVDVYAGMALFAAWIAWRERPVGAVAWIVALLAVGNLVACIYALVAWISARGDAERFWHGNRRVARAGRAR